MQVPLEAVRAATKDDHGVDAVVVAVQPEVSRLGAMERYSGAAGPTRALLCSSA